MNAYCCLHASILAYAAIDCCCFMMHFTCDKYTLTKQMITAAMYQTASMHEEIFAALQSLQMMQQPNRYDGRGNHAKAHCPGEVMSLQRSARQGERSAGRQGSKAPSSSAHLPKAQTSNAGRPRSCLGFNGTIKATRTQRQQTGKTGARKKAEINESEPSGTNSELSNVDALESYSSKVQPLAHVCDAGSSGCLLCVRY